ncbi:jg24916 [Pararge aegeria aegeria]|uniref:Jg24916 protein n=1 Tax=Pararge aegeria aegeria TaxID=348720 RepID=A0A8S4QFX0_9NEOP|nr:jg24916 [Pararge aegeria aegeria]
MEVAEVEFAVVGLVLLSGLFNAVAVAYDGPAIVVPEDGLGDRIGMLGDGPTSARSFAEIVDCRMQCLLDRPARSIQEEIHAASVKSAAPIGLLTAAGSSLPVLNNGTEMPAMASGRSSVRQVLPVPLPPSELQDGTHSLGVVFSSSCLSKQKKNVYLPT